MTHPRLNLNTLVVGGGIAGLWLLHRLRQKGHAAALLESQALGAGQTVCSQGIIHGGIKYALTGKLSAASQSIETMPQVWRDCLAGKGMINLSGTTILSEHQHLWSPGSLTGDISAFFASKSLQSRVNKLEKLPEPFSHPKFKGSVYALNELVLDVPSLLHQLAKPCWEAIIHYQPEAAQWSENSVHLTNLNTTLEYQRVIFLAGKGNQTFSTGIKQQLRPLHMCYLRMLGLPRLYAHCMQSSTVPRITITSHPKDNGIVWYLGGDLAETGVKRSDQEQAQFARQELQQLLPWMDFSQASIHSVRIDRAEEAQWLGRRPSTPSLHQQGHRIIAWPTKLAFAPLLAEQIMERCQLTPIPFPHAIAQLPKPAIASPPWQKARP